MKRFWIKTVLAEGLDSDSRAIAGLTSNRPTAGPRLAILTCPRGGDHLRNEMQSLRAAGVDVLVSMLTRREMLEFDLAEEAEAASRAGLSYWSVPVPDHGVPESADALEPVIQELRAELRRGRSIGVHCWAGIGRSCLLLATLLCAEGYDPQAAFALLSQARGFEVPETQEQRIWVRSFASRFTHATV